MGEDITATRSFCNMKISILIASLALIYATASPIDNVVPEESLIDNEYIHPDDEAHATAQRKVNELLQSGKSDADCRKLAKSTADDVIKSVAAQQAALNKMGRGSQCNVEGSSLIAAAEKSKSTAESNPTSKTTSHTIRSPRANVAHSSIRQCGSRPKHLWQLPRVPWTKLKGQWPKQRKTWRMRRQLQRRWWQHANATSKSCMRRPSLISIAALMQPT